MSVIDRNTKKSVVAQYNIWETFLSEASMGNSFRDSHVLLVGPRNTGKRSLINSVFQNVIGESNNNNKVGSKGQTSALEYTYIQVRNPEDPENDEYISKMNVWMLDDPSMQDLLVHCLREDTIENMIVCICIDMTEPWNALNTLSEWMNIVNERITKVLADMPLYKQDKLREKLAKHIKTYEQPQFDEEGKLIVKKVNQENPDEEQIDLPLPQGVLTVNYGVPIMILGTKSDGLEIIEKEKNGEYKLDFLQYSLRNFGLTYGATLLYMSLKQNINLDIFYDYLLHRFYGFGLRYKAEVVHKDSVFIPAGYDKPKIINETFPNIKSTDIFEEIIAQPAGKKNLIKEEIGVEDTQAFLLNLKTKILAPPDKEAANAPIKRTQSIEKEQTNGTQQGKQSIPVRTTTETKSFFKGLLDNPPGGPTKTNAETTPTHQRAPSQQVTSMTSSLVDNTAGRMTSTITTNSTTQSISSKPSMTKAEKLKELLKK